MLDKLFLCCYTNETVSFKDLEISIQLNSPETWSTRQSKKIYIELKTERAKDHGSSKDLKKRIRDFGKFLNVLNKKDKIAKMNEIYRHRLRNLFKFFNNLKNETVAREAISIDNEFCGSQSKVSIFRKETEEKNSSSTTFPSKLRNLFDNEVSAKSRVSQIFMYAFANSKASFHQIFFVYFLLVFLSFAAEKICFWFSIFLELELIGCSERLKIYTSAEKF
jgi:hypothetical protein